MKHNEVEQKLDEMAAALIKELGREQINQLAIIGIRTGGEALAKAIRERIIKATGVKPPIGMLDITLYRDDLDLKEGSKQPTLRATNVPFAIDQKRLLLVDDVFYTGRTVRAALDALCDLGRPAKIELLVLIDRGFHELPIRPDYIGTSLKAERSAQVDVVYDEKKGWSVILNQRLSHGHRT